MSGFTRESLIDIARHYYPAGFPIEEDDYRQPLLAHQRTPEHERWRSAWGKALKWERWDSLLAAGQSAFSWGDIRDATQAWHSACRRCCVCIKELLPEGVEVITRVSAAISVLAPLYLTYTTTRTRKLGARAGAPLVTFIPSGKEIAHVRELSSLIERELEYSPFPLEFAEVVIPGLRVGYLNRMEPPTLLEALFSDDLANLP
ncbi:hypothetical protein [Stigmatella aurantiaca]|uniref:Uncharacterized protein n=1 Tax=Stigmatella aurantiaca (strain DW4/3-1) TaxID=378806 RepID=E3FJ03_STIAD|nr:hypothetical protein [Stigmatella aurantiaca]ADO67903.1 uncharacterized protein STAUR_0094 [Stigmatella aurantiaca DW4/3-1]